MLGICIFVFLITIYGATAISTGNLISYFTLDDDNYSAPNVLDVWGTDDGTNNGATDGVTGIVDEAFSFTTNDWVEWAAGDFADAEFSGGGTIALWFYLDSVGGNNERVFAFPGTLHCYTDTADSDIFKCYHYDGGDNWLTWTTPNSTEWYFMTYTWDNSEANLYINGDLIDTETNADDPSLNDGRPFCIGAGDSADCENVYVDGDIDEVSIWGEPLALANITELYNFGSGWQYPFSPINNTINITLSDPEDNSNFFGDDTITINFNATVDSVFNGSCDLKINSTVNETINFTNGVGVVVDFNATFQAINANYSWNVFCDNSNETEETSSRILNTFTINIDNCSTYTTSAINFSIKNDDTEELINGTTTGYFTAWVDSVDNLIAFNLSWINISEFGVCINPNSANYSFDAQLEYDAPSFETKTYYFNDATLDNESNFIDLYLTPNSTIVTFTVTDQDDNVVQDVFINILQYDFGTNSHKTVEIIRTDELGQANGNIILSTQWYKFILIFEGDLVLETDPVKISSTERNFRINLLIDFLEFYDIIDGITTSLTFTNSTRNFDYTFINPTGESVTGCLNVIQRSVFGDSEINESCLTSASGSVLVNIGNVTDGLYIGTGTISINPDFLTDVLSVSFDEGYKKFGKDGIFLTFLVRITFAFVGVWNPIVAILLVAAVDLFMVILGIFHLSWEVMLIYLILAGITIYRLNRK